MSWLIRDTDEAIDNVTQIFQYVVNPLKQTRICFGSSQAKKLDRNKLLIGTGPEVGPGKYNLAKTSDMSALLNKKAGCKTLGGIAYTAQRFAEQVQNDVPAPNSYNLKNTWEVTKKNIAPFNKCAKIRIQIDNKVPGVGTYNLLKKTCRRVNKQYNFGNPKVTNEVEILCRPIEYDKCDKCMRVIEKDIEYWHTNYTNYLCTPCLLHEKDFHKRYMAKELQQFKKVRNCNFMHEHGGTLVAVQTLEKKTVKKIQNIENYLSLFPYTGDEKRYGPNRNKFRCSWR